MQIGVLRETLAGETRVAASPKSVEQFLKLDLKSPESQVQVR